MVQNIGLYVYILFAIGWFLFNIRNGAFVWAALIHFLIITVAICLIEYGSSYSLNWDFARWHGGDTWALFPLEVGDGPQTVNTILKTSSTYWIFTVLTTAFYITFPQAVVRGASIRLAKNKLALGILRGLSYTYGIGEGFIGVILTLSSLVSPLPNKNVLVMLVGCATIIIVTWGGIRADLKRGFSSYVLPHIQGGKAVVDAVGLIASLREKE